MNFTASVIHNNSRGTDVMALLSGDKYFANQLNEGYDPIKEYEKLYRGMVRNMGRKPCR